jgi:anti-sigma-K factor RskA
MIESGHVLDLCAGYALGALEPREAAAVASHCAACPQCASELAQMRGIAATLPLTCAEASPSGGLKRRIVAAARSDIAAHDMLRRTRRDDGLSGGWIPWPSDALAGRVWTAAAAALAAAAIIGIVGYSDHQRMAAELAALAAQSASQQAQLAAMGGQMASGRDVIADIAKGRVWDKSGGTGAHWWHCTIFQPPKQKKAMLVAQMPAAPKGMTFQAWVIRRGAAHNAGTVPGGKSSMMSIPMPLETGDVVAFTVEPVGGSRIPTMPYVMEQTL